MSTTTAKTGGSDGFFGTIGTALGNVIEGFGEGLNFAGREILPRFAVQEFLDQRDDQLQNPTFVFTPNTPPNTQFGTDGNAQNPQPQPSGFLFDNINVSVTGLVLAATAVVAVVVLLRR